MFEKQAMKVFYSNANKISAQHKGTHQCKVANSLQISTSLKILYMHVNKHVNQPPTTNNSVTTVKCI